jgi:mono/diheme cytochrome c family protein
MRTLKMVLVFAISAIIGFGFTSLEKGFQKKPWDAPANFKNMKNPKKADPAGINIAKAEWNKSCKSCHGIKGLGDGPKAKTLKTEPGDFSKIIKAQADGEIFYKTKIGRGDMPKFEGKIKDDDIWLLVNYMKTM